MAGQDAFLIRSSDRGNPGISGPDRNTLNMYGEFFRPDDSAGKTDLEDILDKISSPPFMPVAACKRAAIGDSRIN